MYFLSIILRLKIRSDFRLKTQNLPLPSEAAVCTGILLKVNHHPGPPECSDWQLTFTADEFNAEI